MAFGRIFTALVIILGLWAFVFSALGLGHTRGGHLATVRVVASVTVVFVPSTSYGAMVGTLHTLIILWLCRSEKRTKCKLYCLRLEGQGFVFACF